MSENYQDYSCEDFVMHDDFVAWVKGKSSDVDWSELQRSSPLLADKMEEARTLIESLKFSDEVTQAEVNQVWQRIEKSTGTRTIPLWTRWVVGTAAVGLIAVMIWPSLFDSAKISTLASQELTHTFPDQSKIRLDDESRIQYDDAGWSQNRSVKLKGTAFFEVVKGSTFTVETKEGTVEVLGTSFSVEARDDYFRVACRTGSVAVRSRGKEVILKPFESTSLSQGTLQEDTVSADPIFDWMDGIYRFDGRPLRDAFDELERQFSITVKASTKINQSSFKGYFTAEDLEKALESVCWPMNLDWIVEGDTIIVQEPASI